MDNKIKSSIFEEYGKIYSDILKTMYPAKNSSGFPERNLSVNFAKACERVAVQNRSKVYTWYEFQFGEKNNRNVDAVILNPKSKDLIIVESKRYSIPFKKIKDVGKDIRRIKDLLNELCDENRGDSPRIKLDEHWHFYGVILADVWTETKPKEKVLACYQEGEKDLSSENSFLNKYRNELVLQQSLPGLYYSTKHIKYNGEESKYWLVSFMWELRDEDISKNFNE